jgi:hypothetical protein
MPYLLAGTFGCAIRRLAVHRVAKYARMFIVRVTCIYFPSK